MTQATIAGLDPDTTSGAELADLLNDTMAAVRSGNLGSSRPSYAEVGTTWNKTITNGIEIYLFDGADDILIGTVNTASNTFTPSGVTTVTLAGLGGAPTTRSIATSGSLTGGGNLSGDRTLTLVNDNTTPGGSRYYGTNSGGTKGFFPLPAATKEVPNYYEWGPGTHNFVIPAGVTRVYFEVYGAGGGQRTFTDWIEGSSFDRVYPGGAGGCATGTLEVTPGGTVVILVGSAGAAENSADVNAYSGTGGTSGFNGVLCGGGQGCNGNGAGGAVGGVSIDPGLNFGMSAPVIRGGTTVWGNPGSPGLVRAIVWV